jgi:hypothetical protein
MTKYDGVVLLCGHGQILNEIKETTLRQTTMAATPTVYSYGEPSIFLTLLEDLELTVNEKELLKKYQELKPKMVLDRRTSKDRIRARNFMSDKGVISKKLNHQYLEKNFSLKGGYVILKIEQGLQNITPYLKKEGLLKKSDIFYFLEVIGLKNILFLDMSCNDTIDMDILSITHGRNILGGKKKTFKNKLLKSV